MTIGAFVLLLVVFALWKMPTGCTVALLLPPALIVATFLMAHPGLVP